MREDGKIDFVELPAGDLPATKAFYAVLNDEQKKVFEGLDGGLNADPDDRAKAPLVILYATDLEAMDARVRAAGGTITRPIFSFPSGRRFHFRDPSGNELAVWSAA